MDKVNMYGLNLEQLSCLMTGLNQSSYRAKQLFSWLYQKDVKTFDEMTDVSKKFREELNEKFSLTLPKLFTKQVSEDGTIKLLLELEDGNHTIFPVNSGLAQMLHMLVLIVRK